KPGCGRECLVTLGVRLHSTQGVALSREVCEHLIQGCLPEVAGRTLDLHLQSELLERGKKFRPLLLQLDGLFRGRRGKGLVQTGQFKLHCLIQKHRNDNLRVRTARKSGGKVESLHVRRSLVSHFLLSFNGYKETLRSEVRRVGR